jgi:iron-sulfur cluster assembly accessory protein
VFNTARFNDRALSTNAAAAAAATSAPSKPPRVRRPKVDAISLTDAAVDRVKYLLSSKPGAVGVRVGVRTRGCNGLSYTLDYLNAEEPLKPGEDVVETRGVKVAIEPKAVLHLIGTTMDYVEDALKAEFVFNNPNAKGSCGCGESFNT